MVIALVSKRGVPVREAKLGLAQRIARLEDPPLSWRRNSDFG